MFLFLVVGGGGWIFVLAGVCPVSPPQDEALHFSSSKSSAIMDLHLLLQGANFLFPFGRSDALFSIWKFSISVLEHLFQQSGKPSL